MTFDLIESVKGIADAYKPKPHPTVRYIHPPIPDRSSDYCAYYDPEGTVGWGATAVEAVFDLEQQTLADKLEQEF